MVDSRPSCLAMKARGLRRYRQHRLPSGGQDGRAGNRAHYSASKGRGHGLQPCFWAQEWAAGGFTGLHLARGYHPLTDYWAA